MVCAGLLGLAPVIPASAQMASDFGQPQAIEALSPTQLLQDFVHYVRIDQHRLAASMGSELLNRGLTPVEFLGLVEDSVRLEDLRDAIAIARRPASLAALRQIADELDRMYESGRLARARSPEEIARNIGHLTGTMRAASLARDRLVFAGEYAMPQLVEAYLQSQNPVLQSAARQVLIAMGRQAIIPLVTALPDLDPARQELVVNVLAQIDYWTWAPFVLELRATTASERVRQACDRALATRLGGQRLGGDIAYWFFDLAERYYAEKAEVTSFPGEAYQLLWSFNPSVPGSGLVATPVRTEVYHEAMAMRMCERSLRHRTTQNDALGLWLAANFSRELDTPEGYENPAYPSTQREAMYFAVALGVARSQWVLARALDTRNTPLARRAIEAIDRTAGDQAMRNAVLIGMGQSVQERRPLIDALRYPNRRVQYEAALALARTHPMVSFDGAERVVPLLASALRDATRRVALVISQDREQLTAMRDFMHRQGYEVFAGATIADLRTALADTPGVDVVVIDFPSERVLDVITQVRADPRLVATPLMAIASGEGIERVGRRTAQDPTVAVRRPGLAEAELVAAIDVLIDRAAGGPITAEEGRQYANRALSAMRDLAVSGNAVFDVADAASPLIASLRDSQGQMRFRIAEVLSRINQQRVQVAMMEVALDTAGIERIEMLGYVAESAKRHGNLLEERQISQLMDLTLNAQGAEATAAAALMGALNLPSDRIMPLILSDERRAGRTETASR